MNFINGRKVDNSDLIIPFYDEPRSDSQYPCDTPFLKYDKNDHRYYLTEAGISHYGIGCDPSEVKRLIRTATEHIYDYIQVTAKTNYNLMCYRVAKSLFGRFKSEREGRLEVERMLARQAEYINEFGDARKAPKMVVNAETGRIRDNDTDMTTGFWLDDGVLSWLIGNHLNDPNAIMLAWRVEWNKY